MVKDGFLYALGLGVVAAIVWTLTHAVVWAVLPVVLALFFLWFFRDPQRTIPAGPGEIVGTAGQLLVGQGGARDRIVTSDAHGTSFQAVGDFFERFGVAFERELQAFVASCRGEQAMPLELADATEATRIGLAITRSLHSGQMELV